MRTYTTPEQAKKLLKLGIHLYTADMKYLLDRKPEVDEEGAIIFDSLSVSCEVPEYRGCGKFNWRIRNWSDSEKEWYKEEYGEAMPPEVEYFMPCWSLGQLIDIYVTCQNVNGFYTNKEPDYINWVIELIEQSIEANEWDIEKYEKIR